jgi:hypothetical protein
MTRLATRKLPAPLGVVLYNNAVGRVSPTVAGAVPITIPVVAITATDGA